MFLELHDLTIIECMCLRRILAGYCKYMMELRSDIVPPQIEKAASTVTGRTAHYTIEEIIFSPEAHLQAASRERAVIDVEVSAAVLELCLLTMACDPYG
jgi:hypothetical protein